MGLFNRKTPMRKVQLGTQALLKRVDRLKSEESNISQRRNLLINLLNQGEIDKEKIKQVCKADIKLFEFWKKQFSEYVNNFEIYAKEVVRKDRTLGETVMELYVVLKVIELYLMTIHEIRKNLIEFCNLITKPNGIENNLSRNYFAYLLKVPIESEEDLKQINTPKIAQIIKMEPDFEKFVSQILTSRDQSTIQFIGTIQKRAESRNFLENISQRGITKVMNNIISIMEENYGFKLADLLITDSMNPKENSGVLGGIQGAGSFLIGSTLGTVIGVSHLSYQLIEILGNQATKESTRESLDFFRQLDDKFTSELSGLKQEK